MISKAVSNLPGTFFSIGSLTIVSAVNELIPYLSSRRLSTGSTTILDMPLPPGLVSGTYTFYGIIVRAGDNVLDQTGWLTFDSAVFEIN